MLVPGVISSRSKVGDVISGVSSVSRLVGISVVTGWLETELFLLWKLSMKAWNFFSSVGRILSKQALTTVSMLGAACSFSVLGLLTEGSSEGVVLGLLIEGFPEDVSAYRAGVLRRALAQKLCYKTMNKRAFFKLCNKMEMKQY
jgi:hypothetical protein